MKATILDSNIRCWSLATLVLAAGCGDGLLRELPADMLAGNPPMLGEYGQPCGALTNMQPVLSSFSPMGDVVALAVGPGHVELRATSDGHVVHGFDAHLGRVTAMDFSPTENLLATGGIEGAVKLWRDGVLVAQTKVFSRPVARVVWSHDGLSLAATSDGGPIALFGVQGNALNALWNDTRKFGRRLLFSPNDAVVVAHRLSSPLEGTYQSNRIFRVSNGTDLGELTTPPSNSTYSVVSYPVQSQSPDGSVIAYDSTSGGHLTMARLNAEGESLTALRLWERGLQNFGGLVAFTSDSKRIAIWGSGDSSPVNVYDVDNGNLVTTVAWADNTAVGITFSNDGRFALVLDSEDRGGAVRLVDLTSGNALSLATQPRMADALGYAVRVSADATVMASQVFPSTQLDDTAIAIWDLATLQIVRLISWPNVSGSSIPYAGWPALSTKGDLLYGGQEQRVPGTDSSYTQDLRIESLVDPTSSTVLSDPYRSNCLTLTSDGRTLAGAYAYSVDTTGQVDWWIWFYDRGLGAFTGGFSIGNRPASKIRFSPDGSQLVVFRLNGWSTAAGRPTTGLSVWKIPDGQLLWEASAHTLCALDVAFSPDGATLAIVGEGGDEAADCAGVETYDARRGTRLRILEQSSAGRFSVRFSPDGRYLMAPASGDGISIWRTADWQRFNTFGIANGSDAVFLPQNKGVLEVATGVVWCAN